MSQMKANLVVQKLLIGSQKTVVIMTTLRFMHLSQWTLPKAMQLGRVCRIQMARFT
jgi:hypothetical protein